MAASGHKRRDISNSQFGDNTNIYQGDVHLYVRHPLARAEVKVVRVIPYPRNEDLVPRPDLITELDKLLPQTPGSYSAALWGLGGSGKTQIALDYAYRRCDDNKCCVFWVHADSEATLIADYKTIGKKLGVNERLNGSDLLDAVRSSIEAQSQWVIIFDNADNLKLFGVGCSEGASESFYKYIPRGSQGTILWTSRDAHIGGTLVGPSRDIKVPPMTRDEATTLLTAASGDKSAAEDAGINQLLEELQRLPLAVSQAGAYIRRTSMTIKEYLDLLMQGSSRWDLLKINDFDRHRRPEVSNSVLETWKISTTRIREESELSYRILHVIAYLDSQDIPYELIAAASQYNVGDEDRAEQVSEIEVQQAVMRLKEFSFLDMRRGDGSSRSYEMHKLVQEAVRYGLWVKGRMEMASSKIATGQDRAENGEAYYSSMTLQIVYDLFPISEKNSWAQCEKYVTHAIRVGEWAEMSGKELETSALLSRVTMFLYDRGRWREKESVDRRVVDLYMKVFGEIHPETMRGMSNLATAYYALGQYDEAERIYQRTLNLQQDVLGEKHPDTIRSLGFLATTYSAQGRYNEAGEIHEQAVNSQQQVLGEKHPDTLSTTAHLGVLYAAQGRFSEAEGIYKRVLNFRQEVLGENHPDTIGTMADLAGIYPMQGRLDEAEEIYNQVLDFGREVLGERHPETIRSMVGLANTYYMQGQYDKSEELYNKAVDFQQLVLGERHPDTIRCMTRLAGVYCTQGRYNKAQEIGKQALEFQQQVLGERHPDTIRGMTVLAKIYYMQGQYNKAEGIYKKALDLRREVLGDKHPETIKSMADHAATFGTQGQHNKQKSGRRTLREVLHIKPGIFKR